MMSQMDIDALKVLATAYKINSSTYNWLWVYRAGTVGSDSPSWSWRTYARTLYRGALSAVVFLILWCNLSDKISNSEFWHGKCLEFIQKKELQQAAKAAAGA